jgi:hypothetical protein
MAVLAIGVIMGFVVIGHRNWYPRASILQAVAIFGVVIGILSALGLLVQGGLTMLGGNLCG